MTINVSKALLSYASDYFKTLFSNKFSEGHLAELDSNIELEEDEPEAVVNLCKILHMKYTGLRPMGATELLRLAIVADKYMCVEAIGLAADALFPTETKGMACEPVRDLVVAAYLLDQPAHFRRCTKAIMTDYTKSFATVALSEEGQRVPATVWRKYTTSCPGRLVAD